MRSGKDTVLFRLALAAHNWGITPNFMTALGLAFGVSSGMLLAFRLLPFALVFGFASVFCDVMDGTLARKFHLESRFGLIFDSISDRVTEAMVVVGALAGGIIQPIGLVAILGSTSLIAFRAISFKRGLKTDYVFFGRTERLIFVLAGLVSPFVFISSLCFVGAGVIGLLSSFQIAISLKLKKK